MALLNTPSPFAAQYLMWVLAIGPWKVIKGVSWVLNRWQRFVYPVSYGVFYGGDAMDKASAGGGVCRMLACISCLGRGC